MEGIVTPPKKVYTKSVCSELAIMYDLRYYVSISLNAADVEGYVEICRHQAGMKAYESVIEFARQSNESIALCPLIHRCHLPRSRLVI